MCVNRASTGLCGGQWATAVPTATAPYPRRIAQTRHRYRRDQREQVHDPPSESTVKRVGPFWKNHVKTAVSIDFFTVPTIRFQVLYVFLVLAHDRRRILTSM